MLRSAARATRARQASLAPPLYTSLFDWASSSPLYTHAPPLHTHPPPLDTTKLQQLHDCPDTLDDVSLLQLYTSCLTDPSTHNDVSTRVEQEAARRALDATPMVLPINWTAREDLPNLVQNLAEQNAALSTVPHTRAMLLRLLCNLTACLQGNDVVSILYNCGRLGMTYNRSTDAPIIEMLWRAVAARHSALIGNKARGQPTVGPMTASRLCSVLKALAHLHYKPTNSQLEYVCQVISNSLEEIRVPVQLNKLLLALDMWKTWPSSLGIVPILQHWLKTGNDATPQDAVDLLRALKGLLLARLLDERGHFHQVVEELLSFIVTSKLQHVDDASLCIALISLTHIKRLTCVTIVRGEELLPLLKARLPGLVEKPYPQHTIDLLYALPMLLARPVFGAEYKPFLIASYTRYGVCRLGQMRSMFD